VVEYEKERYLIRFREMSDVESRERNDRMEVSSE
jgi:hypothetical protein